VRTCDERGCNIPEHWDVTGDEHERRFVHVGPIPVPANHQEGNTDGND
jgi:hypothetical protein